jgi:hypothetical protein
MRLSHAQARALHSDQNREPYWSGWASLAPEQLTELPSDMGFDELVNAMGAHALPQVLWADLDLTRSNGSDDLLRAALAVGNAQGSADVPASWVKTSWGAMSPLARVHPQARMTGPVRIGPGCIVDRDADVGPAVVLSRNVWVSGGTRVSHSVVLPNSYMGAGLEISHAVVNGSRVRHARLGVETTLPPADALLLDLKSRSGSGHSSLPRLLAGLAWLLVAPALATRAAARRWTGRAPDWHTVPVVIGRDEASQALRLSELRCARPNGQASSATVWALMAGLRDVAAGRRCWFGVRPRGQSQWYALRPEWQNILSRTPVGLLHAQAWTDDPAQREEACAAADIYLSVQPPHKRAFIVLRGMASRRKPPPR